MHIYAFGSVCRGDVSPESDIDLLAIVEGHDARFSAEDYSIYSYERIREIWQEGNPFAWHLAIESKMLFASDKTDFLSSIGKPGPYRRCREDCEKFRALFEEATVSFTSHPDSKIFDLSMVFLAIRNFATCYSLGKMDKPDFSRSAALRLGDRSLTISADAYEVLQRSRILSTRGTGESVSAEEANLASGYFADIGGWMRQRMSEV
jgi:hypothetical protein